VGKLSLQRRPDEVALWGRLRTSMPSIVNAQQFSQKWITWWGSCQPKWRSTGTWPYPRGDAKDKDWARLNVSGPHGLFAVVVSASWLVASADMDSHGVFDAVVEDLHWVIENLIYFNSQSQQATGSGPGVTAAVHFPGHGERDPGKRKIKPTPKVRDVC